MSVIKPPILVCDSCHTVYNDPAEAALQTYTGLRDTASTLRECARDEGWTGRNVPNEGRGRADFCEDCSS